MPAAIGDRSGILDLCPPTCPALEFSRPIPQTSWLSMERAATEPPHLDPTPIFELFRATSCHRVADGSRRPSRASLLNSSCEPLSLRRVGRRRRGWPSGR